MKKLVVIFVMMSSVIVTKSVNLSKNIIPAPVSVTELSGDKVQLTKNAVISYSSLQLASRAEYLSNEIFKQTGLRLRVNDSIGVSTTIELRIDSQYGDLTNDPQHVESNYRAEGYFLKAEKGKVLIVGSDIKGCVNGIQTLLQLVLIGNETTKPIKKIEIAPVQIYDFPRFSYRGMHLDVVRHMIEQNVDYEMNDSLSEDEKLVEQQQRRVDFIKQYIDYLTFHKLNTFHWHLTDDQGWRIEMLSYPKLNSIGSWRDETLVGHFNSRPIRCDGKRYGGYYTREEVKDIIAYAEVRGIEIIPEIDIPGHNRATIAAYPQFSTRPDTVWRVATTWGMFNRQNNVLQPSEETFKFLETVFAEIADLFPSEYIHLGGDECSKMWWKKSEVAQQFITDNNLVDEKGLQTYIVQKVAGYIRAKGKKVMGWEEILEGDVDSNTLIMSWKSEKGGIEAAKKNYNVIMCPSKPLYFNCNQSLRASDTLGIHAYNPLDKVYGYELVPNQLIELGLESKIIGGQACLWTEYISTKELADEMLFPRLTALSEVLWSKPENKDFDDFERRLIEAMIPRYKLWGTHYFEDFMLWNADSVKEDSAYKD